MTRKNQNRQALISASVVDAAGRAGSRFIDATVFDEWRTEAETQRGYAILATSRCIWIPANEQRRRESRIAASNRPTDVVRLSIECYDADNGSIEQTIRFVSADQQEPVINKLTNLLSRSGVYTTTEIYPGTAIFFQGLSTRQANARAASNHIASSWSMPRGFAPVRSAIRS